MKNTAILILILLSVVAFTGMIISVDVKQTEENSVLYTQLETQRLEIEELKKELRIANQDIDFIERLVIEGANGE